MNRHNLSLDLLLKRLFKFTLFTESVGALKFFP